MRILPRMLQERSHLRSTSRKSCKFLLKKFARKRLIYLTNTSCKKIEQNRNFLQEFSNKLCISCISCKILATFSKNNALSCKILQETSKDLACLSDKLSRVSLHIYRKIIMFRKSTKRKFSNTKKLSKTTTIFFHSSNTPPSPVCLKQNILNLRNLLSRVKLECTMNRWVCLQIFGSETNCFWAQLLIPCASIVRNFLNQTIRPPGAVRRTYRL